MSLITALLQKFTTAGKRGMMVFAIIPFSLISLGQTKTFTASGTYVVPAGITSVIVECWGAGGGGGSSNTMSKSRGRGGGGGGGAYSSTTIVVTPGNSYNIVVGTGGTGGVAGNGSAGGASTFDATSVVANGGKPGNKGSNGSAGTGAALTLRRNNQIYWWQWGCWC